MIHSVLNWRGYWWGNAAGIIPALADLQRGQGCARGQRLSYACRYRLAICAPDSLPVDGFYANNLCIQPEQNQHHPKHYEVVFSPPVTHQHHQVKRPQEQVEERADHAYSRHCRFSLPRQEPSVDESRPVPSIWRLETPKWRVQRTEDHNHGKNDNNDKA